MESFGELLKNSREAKEIDLETAARETMIARFYIEAMESEDTSAFPGEPYLVGFLKNYSSYLGLDQNRIVNLYRAKILQESPVPEGLIVHEKPKFLFPLIVSLSVLAILAVLGTIAWFGYEYIVSHIEAEEVHVPVVYELTDKTLKERLYIGDQLVLSPGGKNVVLTVASTRQFLVLETPAGRQNIELSDNRELDINADGINDIIIQLNDIDAVDEKRGAEVVVKLCDPTAAVALSEDSIESDIESVSQTTGMTVIFEDTRAYPFTVVATFRAGCLFRYHADRKDVVEDYLSSREEVRVTANNSVRLWMQNGNTIKLQVVAGSKSYDLGVGKPGTVLVEDIKWIKDTDGKFKLVVVNVD